VDLDPRTHTVTYRPGMIPKLNEPMESCPSPLGVKNWPAMAWSPETQALYIPFLMTCVKSTYTPVPRKPGGGGLGMGAMQDSDELAGIVEQAMAANERAVAELREGKDKAIGPIIGFVMKQTQGRADGGEVTRIVREKLGL